MIINIIILIVIGLILAYDMLWLELRGKDTITERIHQYIIDYKIPKMFRLGVTVLLCMVGWHIGGIPVAVPMLLGWMLCHLIGWDL